MAGWRVFQLARSFLWVVVLMVTAPGARAATTALYLFDEQTAEIRSFSEGQVTSDVWPDSSGNDLAIVRRLANFKGRVWRHPDTPAVIGAGTSLEEYGGNPVEAPISGNYSFGASGQKTVEFWYQSRLNDTLRYILSQDNVHQISGDGWSLAQLPPDPSGMFALRFDQLATGVFSARLDTPAIFQRNRWYHIAVTADTTSRVVKIYQNGNEVASGTILNFLVGPKDDAPLILGADSTHGFVGHFLIDELRFSDKALLPGGGSGVGELAWNTSLAMPNPEPGTLGVALVVSGVVLLRRSPRGRGRISQPAGTSSISVLVLGMAIGLCGHTQAATTGLYLFDQIESGSHPDLGPDDLDFSFSRQSGSVNLSADVPAVIGAGMSVHSAAAIGMDTPITGNGNFSPGTTGQITAEFWYKSLLADTTRLILTQDEFNSFGAGNGWTIQQELPNVSGNFGVRLFLTDSGYQNLNGLGGNVEPGHIMAFRTPDLLHTNQWYHLAFTVDLGTGTGHIYVDGVKRSFVSGFGLDTMNFGAKTNAPLRMGALSSASGGSFFQGNFRLDELRFSDTALLPGNGSGVGELAWNVSLAALPVLFGDANYNGQVTGLDLIAVQQNFATTGPIGQLIGDANYDGQVTGRDLITVQQNFGIIAGGFGPVSLPEPSVALVLGIGVCLGLCCRCTRLV